VIIEKFSVLGMSRGGPCPGLAASLTATGGWRRGRAARMV